jgi:hypothetical protein
MARFEVFFFFFQCNANYWEHIVSYFCSWDSHGTAGCHRALYVLGTPSSSGVHGSVQKSPDSSARVLFSSWRFLLVAHLEAFRSSGSLHGQPARSLHGQSTCMVRLHGPPARSACMVSHQFAKRAPDRKEKRILQTRIELVTLCVLSIRDNQLHHRSKLDVHW